MISLPLRFLTMVALALPAAVAAAELPIIARARARIAPEAVLDDVKSLHFYGTISIVDSKEPAKVRTGKIEMIFQKPDLQKMTIAYDKAVPPDEHPLIEITALDAYEGWLRKQDATDATKWKLTLLDANRVKQLRAGTWESLNYFRGIEKRGGRVEDEGAVTKDGVACRKVAFIHGPNIVFHRFFDAVSGQLVLTEINGGMTVRETGEMKAGGIRFSKTNITTQPVGGGTQTVTINYDKIVVNETVSASEFSIPPIKGR